MARPQQATRMLAALEKPFAGITGQFNARPNVSLADVSFTRASYACYGPASGRPFARGVRPGKLFFRRDIAAGTFKAHDGGAETGNRRIGHDEVDSETQIPHCVMPDVF